MALHMRQILSMLLRAGWSESAASARVQWLASMGARIVLVATLAGCYSLPARYRVDARGPCNPGDDDRGIYTSTTGATWRQCERAE